jgi:hypothetical protein
MNTLTCLVAIISAQRTGTECVTDAHQTTCQSHSEGAVQHLVAMSHANTRACARLSFYPFSSGRYFRNYSNQPWDATNPTSYWSGGASAYKDRKPSHSNKWLLHPWLPVDIRWPVFIGIFGAAAFIQLERSPALSDAQKRSKQAWDSYVAPWLWSSGKADMSGEVKHREVEKRATGSVNEQQGSDCLASGDSNHDTKTQDHSPSA